MKIKLAVLFGGKSVEHEISIISAVQAMRYINRDKYDVIPVYITKTNEMYHSEDMVNIEEFSKLKALLKKSRRVTFSVENGRTMLVKTHTKAFEKKLVSEIDLAFPIVHGTNCEDGTLHGYLKMMNLPLVGCDITASAIGMDKYYMKTVFKDNGIPVLDCKCFTAKDYNTSADTVAQTIEDTIGYPVIIKPVNLGSSVGISKAANRDELDDALQNAFNFAGKILAERAVENLKEVNCSVLGDIDEAQASECEEPVNSDKILSYEDKYTSGGKGGAKGGSKGGSKGMASLKRKIPADITPEQRDTIREMAVNAFKCLGCNGIVRIDFMIDKSTGEIFLNEINTIPGSLSFYLWEPLGVKYTELLDRMIQIALKRNREQAEISYAFDTNVLEGVSFGGAKGSKM
ncbi:MAG: D-alanine--D-alanine ligase [Clostridia bacterium]|nr:D-alanine--D-alanine ligase [Clostridia bacterium]